MIRVPFCDLSQAHYADGAEIEAAVRRVLRSGQYIAGAELEAFETEWAAACQARHAVGVGSGTDALALLLRAAGIGAGDEVIVPAYTAAATWMAVSWVGATPVGADVDVRSGLVDPAAVAAACGPRTAAVIAVHLFGRLAPLPALRQLTRARSLMLIEDAAHAHGADEGDGPAGSLADAAAFSFYPTKLLGAAGDAGAVVTSDDGLAARVRALGSYGWTSWGGDALRPGTNSRLDEAQAAILRVRLASLTARRRRIGALALRYRRALNESGEIELPQALGSEEPAWHQFVIGHPQRNRLRASLLERGVDTAVHYDPIPPAFSAFRQGERFPAALRKSQLALSLPLDPWLDELQVDAVACALLQAR